jgi:hypothetical protein
MTYESRDHFFQLSLCLLYLASVSQDSFLFSFDQMTLRKTCCEVSVAHVLFYDGGSCHVTLQIMFRQGSHGITALRESPYYDDGMGKELCNIMGRTVRPLSHYLVCTAR